MGWKLALHHEALVDLLGEVDEPNARAGFDAWTPPFKGWPERRWPMRSVTSVGWSLRRSSPTTRGGRFRYVPDLTNYVPDPGGVQAVPVGEGLVDYGCFFAALREIGFSGYVTDEMCSPLRGGGDNQDRYAGGSQSGCAASFRSELSGARRAGAGAGRSRLR
jgi:hypothetical protein